MPFPSAGWTLKPSIGGRRTSQRPERPPAGSRLGVGGPTGRRQAPDRGGRTHPERQRGKRDTGGRDSTPAEQVGRRRPGCWHLDLYREPDVGENLPDDDEVRYRSVMSTSGRNGCYALGATIKVNASMMAHVPLIASEPRKTAEAARLVTYAA